MGAGKEGAISQVAGDYYQTTQMLQVPITIEQDNKNQPIESEKSKT